MDECFGFSTELFPDFQKDACMEDISASLDPSSRRTSECRSDGAVSYDSDDSSVEVDVGEPDQVLKVDSCTAGEDELVSYLTTKQNNPKTLQSGVKIVNIAGNRIMPKLNQFQPRVIIRRPDMDKSNTIRVIKTIGNRNDQNIGVINVSKSTHRTTPKSNHSAMSKSAIAARENREKKKKYVSQLENSVQRLTAENKEVKEQNKNYSNAVDELKNEVLYLKSVLASQSTLSKLLQNIPGIPDITFTSSEDTFNNNRKRSNPSASQSDGSDQVKKQRQSSSAIAESKGSPAISVSGSDDTQVAGVCLHVSGCAVSLELCATCNKKAQSTKL